MVEGYNYTFSVALVLGHFYFNKLLLPLLISTAKQEGIPGQIIITSSIAELAWNQCLPINYETLKDGPVRNIGTTMDYYSQTKFA
jgi:retinol dehydrogenase-12